MHCISQMQHKSWKTYAFNVRQDNSAKAELFDSLSSIHHEWKTRAFTTSAFSQHASEG
jgi:hypothetical protein